MHQTWCLLWCMTRKPFWGNDDGNVTLLITRNTPMTGPVSVHSIELTISLLELFIRYSTTISSHLKIWYFIFENYGAKECGVLGLTGSPQPWDTTAGHKEEVQVEDCDDRQEQEGEQEGEDVEEPQSTELLLLSAVVASWFIQSADRALGRTGLDRQQSQSLSVNNI